MILLAAVLSAVLASAYVFWLTRVGPRGRVASARQVAQPAGADGEETRPHCVLCGAPLAADADDLLSRAAPGRPALRSPSTEARQ